MGSIVMCEHGTLEGMYCDDCEAELIPIRRRREAERAVIEAAKEALEWVDGCEEFEDAMGLLDACKGVEDVLRPALEALTQATEEP